MPMQMLCQDHPYLTQEEKGCLTHIISAVMADEEADTLDTDLPTLQKEDPELAEIIKFLETGVLSRDEKIAKRLALTQSQYLLQDEILYHVEPDSTLRLIPPSKNREQLFKQAHGGVFGGHLRDVKVHSELQRHYWWPGMRGDVSQWSRGCLVCATQHWTCSGTTPDTNTCSRAL